MDEERKMLSSHEDLDHILRGVNPDLWRAQRTCVMELSRSNKIGLHERELLTGLTPVLDVITDYMADVLEMEGVLLTDDRPEPEEDDEASVEDET